MTYLHDPHHRAVPHEQSHGGQVPRQRSATPYPRDDREAADVRMRIDTGAEAGTTGFHSFVCSDCNLGFGRHVHLHLRSAASEVGKARAAVGEALLSWGCPSGVVDDSRLLVSELLANAIKYAPDTWTTLDLMQIGDRLLVEVTDGSAAQPVVHQAGPQEEQGRGMFLVQAIASAWGARRDRRGRKTTWCTVAIDGSGGTPPR
ncbi:ATP-binding protein [Streptomyces sp. NPDC007905]|uniref:ATP-binding protein n=1 Tax=Streptomyces sp. NPDC007905 TaxID=3364788 RepID=UPI0036F18744